MCHLCFNGTLTQLVDYISKYSLRHLHASGFCGKTASSGGPELHTLINKYLAKARPVSNTLCLGIGKGRKVK
jgi:hypothetical protein